MLTNQELTDLLALPEKDRIERKASGADIDEIKKNVCAFANDLAGHRLPGVLFVGVHDDGRCAEIAVDDELLRSLAGVRDGNMIPLPVVSIDPRRINNCHLIVVQVEPATNPPVRFRGRTWIRVGPTLRSATPEEEARLIERRRWGNLPFDHHPLDASVDDLDLDFFRNAYLPHAIDPEVLVRNQRTPVQQLSSLRILTPDGIPTVGGVLVIGKNPVQLIPGAYIQFVRFAGKQITDPVRDQKQISGPLSEMMKQLDDLLTVHIVVSAKIVGEHTEQKYFDYPIEALRQLMRNAFMHRTYEATNSPVRFYWFDDRIEILSPGGLFGIVSRENFGTPGVADYRNPLLAEAMKTLGYVQKFGVGLGIARQELERNGNPPLEFAIEVAHVLVTVRSRT